MSINKNKKKSIISLWCFFSVLLIKNMFAMDDIKNKENSMDNKKLALDNKILTDKQKYNQNCCGVIVIGGGPAGLAAGTYCARLGIPSTTIIMGKEPGGELMKTGIVENWPGIVAMSGRTIMENTMEQAKKSGANLIYEYVKEIVFTEWPFKVITNKSVYYAFSIVLATGSTIKKLECKGEDTYWGKGVSSCAICDAPMHKDKTVIVVGGGDSACEEVLQLIPHAKMIYVLVRGDKMRASYAMQEKIKHHSKVKILYNTKIKEIIGNDNGVSDAILMAKNEEVKFSTINVGPTFTGIFIAIGNYPNTSLVDAVIEKLPNGLIKKFENSQATSFEGLFCAGDVSNSYRQAGVAAGEGAMAAINAFNFLENYNINTQLIEDYSRIWFKPAQIKPDNTICQDGVCSLPENLSSINQSLTTNNIHLNVNRDNKINEINSEKKYNELISTKKEEFYIVDFYGTYCPACDVMKKTLAQYVKKENHVAVYAVNLSVVPSLGSKYSIRSIPTILLIKNGKIIARQVGSMSLAELEAWINKKTK